MRTGSVLGCFYCTHRLKSQKCHLTSQSPSFFICQEERFQRIPSILQSCSQLRDKIYVWCFVGIQQALLISQNNHFVGDCFVVLGSEEQALSHCFPFCQLSHGSIRLAAELVRNAGWDGEKNLAGIRGSALKAETPE